jgi:hypothetical protein
MELERTAFCYREDGILINCKFERIYSTSNLQITDHRFSIIACKSNGQVYYSFLTFRSGKELSESSYNISSEDEHSYFRMSDKNSVSMFTDNLPSHNRPNISRLIGFIPTTICEDTKKLIIEMLTNMPVYEPTLVS